MQNFLYEKRSIAMLTIPLLLSILLGLSSGPYRDTSLSDRDGEESRIEDDGIETPHKFRSEEKGIIQNQKFTSYTPQGTYKTEQLRNAVASNNYEAFIHAVEGTSFAEIMDKESFGVLVETYNRKILS